MIVLGLVWNSKRTLGWWDHFLNKILEMIFSQLENIGTDQQTKPKANYLWDSVTRNSIES